MEPNNTEWAKKYQNKHVMHKIVLCGECNSVYVFQPPTDS